MNRQVMVGMSGGVDSSVAALLLKEQGYDVAGVTFRLWTPENEESGCCSVDDVNDARIVCHTLGIPHYVFNLKDLFKEKVVDEFILSYKKGETPNPCILCNRYIKFSMFLDKAEAMGFGYIATGHYASAVYDVDTGAYRLKKGTYDKKDQSYVLYTLTQRQLSSLLLPLGDLPKEEVRSLAEKNGLIVHGKADSQDICFIPDGDYAAFLGRHGLVEEPGDFIDSTGNVIGRHKGISRYTIGQRKGLGLSLGAPAFVTGIDPGSGRVMIGGDGDLWKTRLTASDVNWIDSPRSKNLSLYAKIRYAHKAEPAAVTVNDDGTVGVEFEKPQRAITPGQAVVFYDDDYVVGGGTIIRETN